MVSVIVRMTAVPETEIDLTGLAMLALVTAKSLAVAVEVESASLYVSVIAVPAVLTAADWMVGVVVSTTMLLVSPRLFPADGRVVVASALPAASTTLPTV
jgi:multisubunit Na+/H+ antiporter MnhE subunit